MTTSTIRSMIRMNGSRTTGLRRRSGSRLWCAVAMTVLALTVLAPVAQADFGIESFDGQLSNADASASSQAGAHPYALTTRITFNGHPQPPFTTPLPDGDVRNIFVDLPPGFVGDPTVTSEQCDVADLVTLACPIDSQVGVALSSTILGDKASPIFNVTAPPNAPAEFGFVIASVPVLLTPTLRSGSDYGLTIGAHNVPQTVPVHGATVTFWGVPADPSHDLQRCAQLDVFVDPPICDGSDGGDTSNPHSSAIARVPFLRNPTSCTAPGVGLETKLSVDSWQNTGAFVHSSYISRNPAPDEATQVGITGCDLVPFNPKISAQPNATRASATTGWAFDVSLPQNKNPDGLAQADLRKAVVTLPAGVSVSPSSADGLGGCSPLQLGLHTTEDANCPDPSKIGSVVIDTPLLKDPVKGSIYLASPNDNPFSSLIAIYLVAKGPGLIIKLAGHIQPDPVTGQIRTTFDDNPQLPFSNLHLEFKNGPRAPLVSPATCGTYTTTAEFTSWSGKTVERSNSFTIDQSNAGTACAPLAFDPDFEAGTKEPIAGKSTSFLLSLKRGDDDQQLRSLTVKMPRGLLGKVKSAEQCSNDAANAGRCGETSKVGSVSVSAGAGSNPFWITNGRAYFTGPYKGAPFGLSIVVPAKAGPFDLGDVVVRAAIFVDRTTTALRVVSDPLPTILQGIPLDVREVRVAVDKPGFIVNPTSCAAKQVTGTIGSTEGAVANVATHFQMTNCAALPFRPRLSITVGRKGHVRAGSSTPLTAVVRMPRGSANLAGVKVTLPRTLNALLPVIEKACTRDELAAGRCTARAGTATAVTPLLKDPLNGTVYFVKRADKGIPDLVVALRGPIDVDLTGRVQIPDSGVLGTNFQMVPDAPITKFTLRLVDGTNGPIGVAESLCRPHNRRAKMNVVMKGQNGAVVRRAKPLIVRGC